MVISKFSTSTTTVENQTDFGLPFAKTALKKQRLSGTETDANYNVLSGPPLTSYISERGLLISVEETLMYEYRGTISPFKLQCHIFLYSNFYLWSGSNMKGLKKNYTNRLHQPSDR